MAMFLRGRHLPLDLKRRNFDYYDPITTGDSSLSACVQSIVAAQVGHRDLADRYFDRSLFLDLADTHGNTDDGVHIANAGGVWAAVVHGFAGMSDDGMSLRFQPRLPSAWASMSFRLRRRDTLAEITVRHGGCEIRRLAGPPLAVETPDGVTHVTDDTVLRLDNDDDTG